MEKILIKSETELEDIMKKEAYGTYTVVYKSWYEPESYPCMFVFQVDQDSNSAFDYLDYEYVYPSDFKGE